MPDVSSSEAAEIIGVSSQTIRRQIKRGLLTARLEGTKGLIRVDVSDLRLFAKEYQYRFNEELAAKHAK